MNNQKPIIFLDGTCVLCNKLGMRIMKIDKKHNLLLSTLTGEAADEARKTFPNFPDAMDTVVFVEKGKLYVRSDAVLRMVKHLPFPHYIPGFFLWVPRFVRDFFYNIIAGNRKKWFGEAESCPLNSGPQERILP